MKNRWRTSVKNLIVNIIVLAILAITFKSSAQTILIPDSLPHYLKICSESKHSSENFEYIAGSIIYNPMVPVHLHAIDSMLSDHFKGGNEEELGLLKYFVFLTLSQPFSNPTYYTDSAAGLEYGLKLYSFVSKSSSPAMKTIQWLLLQELRLPYRNSNKNYEGLIFFNEELKRFLLQNDSTRISQCYFSLGSIYRGIGLIDQGIYYLKKSLQYIDTLSHDQYDFRHYPGLRTLLEIQTNRTMHMINRIAVLGEYYLQKKDYNSSKLYSRHAITLYETHFPKFETAEIIVYARKNMLASYTGLSELDSAAEIISGTPDDTLLRASIEAFIAFQQVKAIYYLGKKEYHLADSALNDANKYLLKYKFPAYSSSGFIQPDFYRAILHIERGQLYKAMSSLLNNIQRINNVRPLLIENYRLLADVYGKLGMHKLANESFKQYMYQLDSLRADQALYSAVNFETEQQIAASELAITKLMNKNQLYTNTRNFSLILSGMLILLAIGIFHRYHFQKKTSSKLSIALNELQSTQAQLIQSEKMASLGELTAGIAHEIQNPLNFVNNFAEVNKELNAEGRDAFKSGNLGDAEEIMNTMVKGMLQHSRTSSGVKEPTDINALVDEYLRLAFHGMRAKDKLFNAEYSFTPDTNIGKVNMVPQDIGRVILNLVNNAFYAVHEKKKQVGDSYEPKVTLSTRLADASNSPSIRQSDNSLIISVTDNGNGIPVTIRNKIFQPFFTTKPTGEGTGLGLSLSYDIVKAHGGEIIVNTKPGEYTEMQVVLPA
jgi:signal transduction histidine kinase